MPKLNDPQKSLGIGNSYDPEDPSTKSLNDYINLKLAAKGFEIVGDKKDYPFLDMSQSLLENYKQSDRLLSDHLCPVDKRIDDFVKGYLNEFPEELEKINFTLPSDSLVLERHGIARILSIPHNEKQFKSSIVSSYKVAQGVCNNPAKDRRTTKGVFHIVEGGLPIPADKKSVPKITFARLLKDAMNPPDE